MSQPMNKLDQSERALKALLVAILIGVLGVIIYAIQSTQLKSFFTTASTGLLVGAASLFIGALLGFLFGIPRTLQRSGPPANSATNPADPNLSGTPANGTEFQANTNLEQISDWLTKILVGVGLTQVNNILERLRSIASTVTRAMGATSVNCMPPAVCDNNSFAMALILFFLVIGFLFAYLWTRLHLAKAFKDADLSVLKVDIAEVNQKLKDAQANALGTGKEGSEEVKKKLLEVTDGIEPGDQSDPWKGRFGGQSVSNDRQLVAEVKPFAQRTGLYSIRLTVSSLHPDTNPLGGAVQFFLHPTFNNPTPIVTVGTSGVAELNLKAWGAFTVGAVVDNGVTKLELDLSQLQSAPMDFRNS
jgi:uncharacterized integral membrane protein